MKQHLQVHMLPKMTDNGSSKKLEWKIVEPNEDGRFNCLDCKETFSDKYAVRNHHKRMHMKEDKFNFELEKIQHGWVVCLKCHKTFFCMENGKCHFKNDHVDKDVAVNNESARQSEEELDFDPDLGLAPLDDGRVICLRCTLLCSNMELAKRHYEEEHMTRKL